MTSVGLAKSVLRGGPSFQRSPRHVRPQPPEPIPLTAALRVRGGASSSCRRCAPDVGSASCLQLKAAGLWAGYSPAVLPSHQTHNSGNNLLRPSGRGSQL